MYKSNTFFDENFAVDLFASFESTKNDDKMSISSNSAMSIFSTVKEEKMEEKTEEKENTALVFNTKVSNSPKKEAKKQRLKKFKPNINIFNLNPAKSDTNKQTSVQEKNTVKQGDLGYEITPSGSFMCQDIRIGKGGIKNIPVTQSQSLDAMSLSMDSQDIFCTPPQKEMSFTGMSPPPLPKVSPIKTPPKRTKPQKRKRNVTPTKSRKKFKYEDICFEDLIEIKHLGSGASSSVDLVQDKISGMKFARKIITVNKDIQAKIIVSEIKSLYKCRKCPYIVSMYQAFFRENKIYILLEFMENNSLEDLQKRVGKIPEEILAYVATKVLKGLKYLHNVKKIIHRDIKPANILINGEGEVKVGDLGLTGIISSALKSSLEMNSQDSQNYGLSNPLVFKTCQGTILYMSPERVKEEPHSFNSDIWSLGITLVELRMGRFPFNTKGSYFDIMEEISSISGLELPRDLFSSEFRDFIWQCLKVDQKERPSAVKLINHPFIKKYACDDATMNKRIRDFLPIVAE